MGAFTSSSPLLPPNCRIRPLGDVLVWPITSKSTLQQGLYTYDAIARLQYASLPKEERNEGPVEDIGRYIKLGPLGTAFLQSEKKRPKVLLIDEVDKSDIDFPNDLLNIFEEGYFEIPELARLHHKEEDEVFPYASSKEKIKITQGHVVCKEFPLVIMTSNEEREFPPAFLRRCLRLDIKTPTSEKLAKIVAQHFGDPAIKEVEAFVKKLIEEVKRRQDEGENVATDQLLNAVYLLTKGVLVLEKKQLLDAVLQSLSEAKL